MPGTLIRIIYSRDRNRRMHMYRRADGTFGFHEEIFSNADDENHWFGGKRLRLNSFGSETDLIRVAKSNLDWLKDSLHDVEYRP